MGALWLVSSVFAAALMDEANGIDEQEEDFAPLFVPVVGPFIAIGTLEAEGLGTALLMLDGIGQVGGLAMLIAGVAAKKSVFVRDFSVAGHEITVEAQPLVGTKGAGMGLTGTF
jgi:glutamate mutase epsilon subunit